MLRNGKFTPSQLDNYMQVMKDVITEATQHVALQCFTSDIRCEQLMLIRQLSVSIEAKLALANNTGNGENLFPDVLVFTPVIESVEAIPLTAKQFALVG